MKCIICKEEKFVKNGFHHGVQRFKCRHCGYQYTKENSRKGDEAVHMAVAMYAVGLSYRTIGKLIGVSNVTIYRWIRNYATVQYEKPKPKGEICIELDEMWHFIKSKKTNAGFGKRIAEQLDNLLTGNAANVTRKRS